MLHLELTGEVRQRAVARPEVVDNEPHTQRFELFERSDGGVYIVHRDALGDLQRQAARPEPGFLQDPSYVLHQPRMLELAQREIYTHYRGERVARAPLLPLACLATGFLQHPPSDGNDEPGLFGERDELSGAHRAALGMLPTQEGFHPGNVIAHQRVHRLVVDPELVALDSLPEVVLQLQAL